MNFLAWNTNPQRPELRSVVENGYVWSIQGTRLASHLRSVLRRGIRNIYIVGLIVDKPVLLMVLREVRMYPQFRRRPTGYRWSLSRSHELIVIGAKFCNIGLKYDEAQRLQLMRMLS